ncbi:MAG: membrane protein [Parcubacteria group bacterium Gr01-1014_44]|nr:MAG: membrane protein [Parcubacteria group bacterium Gr01-1014_44]
MVNRVIKRLVISDFIFNFAFGLLGPIFAIFILKNVPGSSLKVIGLSTAFYWISRTLTTVPLSRFMDKTDGERDEFYFSLFGSFLIASIPLFYLLIKAPWHLYLIQLIYGIGNSMAVPAWRILFTDHIDKGKTGYEWSLEDVAIGISVGISAYLGSILAEKFGFSVVLILLSSLGYVATLVLIPLYKDAKTLAQIKREKRLQIILEKRKNPTPFKIDGVR